MKRRHFIGSAVAAIATQFLADRAQADAASDFAALFAKAQNNPALIVGGGGSAERIETTRKATPHYPPSHRGVPQQAIDMIILFEVSSPSYYTKLLKHPTWPKGKSGVTIGVGYDIGYSDKEQLNEDWKGLISDAALSKLETACNIYGGSASKDGAVTALKNQLHDVVIDWEPAHKQFVSRTLPRFTAMTEASLSNTAKLSDLSLGALVSLVYNRGAPFHSPAARYREMVQIREAMEDQRFSDIPQYISNMKHLWVGQKDMAGLLTRRDLEATLFRAGLKTT